MAGRQELDTNVGDYNLVIQGEEGNAAGICKQFASAQPAQLDPLLYALEDTYNLARTTMATELDGIKKDLAAAWEGDGADKAQGVLDDFSNNVDSLRSNAYKIHMSLSTFRDKLAGYKSEAAGLDSGGFGGNNDDTEARALYKKFLTSQNESLDSMPNSLYYWQPLTTNGGNQDTQIPGPGPAGGPGPGIPGPGPGPGPSITPGHTGPSVKPPEFPSPSEPPGPSIPGTTGGPGPGATISPYDPSSFGGGGGAGTGGGAGGVGYDDGSSLAGAGGGAGPAGGLGGGTGGGLPGDGSLAGGTGGGAGGGAGGGLAGGGAGGLVGGGAGAGAGGGAGGGRGMMMPMHGGGGNDGDEERERNTWLEEDEDVWGGGDAPSGVIS